MYHVLSFFFSSRRRHTRWNCDWSSDVCSSDLPKGVAASGVRLKLGTPVKAIDRAARAVMTDAGERIGYDALVLAIGSINRMLPMFPARQKGVYYLRTEAEARA